MNGRYSATITLTQYDRPPTMAPQQTAGVFPIRSSRRSVHFDDADTATQFTHYVWRKHNNKKWSTTRLKQPASLHGAVSRTVGTAQERGRHDARTRGRTTTNDVLPLFVVFVLCSLFVVRCTLFVFFCLRFVGNATNSQQRSFVDTQHTVRSVTGQCSVSGQSRVNSVVLNVDSVVRTLTAFIHSINQSINPSNQWSMGNE